MRGVSMGGFPVLKSRHTAFSFKSEKVPVIARHEYSMPDIFRFCHISHLLSKV